MKTTACNPEKEMMKTGSLLCISFGVLSIITAIALLIISLAVLTKANAQDNHSLLALDKHNNELVFRNANILNSHASSDEKEEEAPLTVETWMSSNTYWKSTPAAETLEAEPALAIENWMSNNSYWGAENATEVLEYEAPLAVEYWMHCNNYWGLNNNHQLACN